MSNKSVASAAQASPPGSALYRAVWRWHFYAGILVAPFVVFLAITGSVYLWKPQYEAWRYRDLFTVPVGSETVAAEVQFKAAQAAVPTGWRAITFQPGFAPGETTQVAFKATGEHRPFGPALNIYVNPYTGAVVGQLSDEDRLMDLVHDLHGTMLAGKPGQYLVELAASWAFVLFLTGLYLWWPRPTFSVWGFLLPRLRAEGRTFWRDIHAVPAVWCAAGTLFLLTTGLLWSQASGSWYRKISATLGQGTPRESSAGAHRSELTGWSPPLKSGLAEKINTMASEVPGHEGHNMGGGHDAGGPAANALPLDRIVVIATTHNVPQPYAIALPVGPQGVYSVMSDRNQAFNRTYLHLDQYSGKVLADVRFKDFGYLAQFSLWGIAAHEGQLFGLANQILGTLAAGGVMLIAISGLVMWWQRRPTGRFAANTTEVALPRAVFLGTLVLAVFLPLLAGTLVLVWCADSLFAVGPFSKVRR